MKNEEIIRQIKLYGALLELQGENSFKVRSYQTAAFHLEKLEKPLAEMSLTEIEKLEGIGKALAAKIDDARTNGQFRQLGDLLAQIPAGVVAMLSLDGLGVKKVQTLWKTYGFEDLTALLEACENNQIAPLKGFGAKTQENIRQALLFRLENTGKVRLPQAEKAADQVLAFANAQDISLEMVGQLRRSLPVIEQLDFLTSGPDETKAFAALDQADFLEKDLRQSRLFVWAGRFRENQLRVQVRYCPPAQLLAERLVNTAAPAHLGFVAPAQTQSLMQLARQQNFSTETAFYEALGFAYHPPETREGPPRADFPLALLETKDLKGILHAHSTYSDGKHRLEEMARACQQAGYEYLGITDHSQSAFYANGLKIAQIQAQHAEIDALNQVLAPFRIFKGIEADILADGSLDYPDEVLQTFDFVIASVHANLKMDKAKATQRLLKAIAHPYTTILGHLSGRILLRREGYPLEYEAILEACAAHGVVIEINASPYRLDLDWTWVEKAREKGILLSINPDAHEMAGIGDVRYGVQMGRKGFLSASHTLNTLSAEALADYFEQRKRRIQM
ncbi:MAG: helix-hairpin-helix domain-containing protein [Microscillaceae bacterium]